MAERDRTIAAAFARRTAAEAAHDLLLGDRVLEADIALAPGAIAESNDGPIRRPVTLVVVGVDGDGRRVRALLEAAGGIVMADVVARDPRELHGSGHTSGGQAGHAADQAGHGRHEGASLAEEAGSDAVVEVGRDGPEEVASPLRRRRHLAAHRIASHRRRSQRDRP